MSLPPRMRAIAFREHGDIDVLEEMDLPRPEPGAGEVLVAMRACALNHLDLWVRKGWPGIGLDLPHILGADVAGEIAGVGPGVHGVREGDAVIVQPGVSCGVCAACVAGRDNHCPHYKVLGEHTSGGYCDYLVVPAANVTPKPASLSFEEAASLPVTFLTAWHMLVERARVQRGDLVMVHAAGSGVGVASVQIARMLGATVVATASTDEKLRLATELGAEHTINYSDVTVREGFKAAVGRRGADVIVEHVGAATWADSLRCLAKGGRLVTCGATTGHDVRVDLRHLFIKQQSLLGSTMGTKAELRRCLERVEAGELKPVVDRVLPLAEAAIGHRSLQERAQFGKIVLLSTAAR